MKRWGLLFVVFSLVLTLLPVPWAVAEETYWAGKEIRDFRRLGYLDGIYGQRPDKQPDEGLSRSEFVSMMVSVFRMNTGEESSLRYAQRFPDLQGHWAVGFIEAAIQYDLIDGYEDGTFRPDRTITRAEAATLLTRALYATLDALSSPFADTRSHWAKPYIDTAYSEKLVQGYTPSNFGPDRTITLAEGVVLLYRMKRKIDAIQMVGIRASDAIKTGESVTLEPIWTEQDLTAELLTDNKMQIHWTMDDGYRYTYTGGKVTWTPALAQPVNVQVEVWMNKVLISRFNKKIAVNGRDGSADEQDRDRDGLSDQVERSRLRTHR